MGASRSAGVSAVMISSSLRGEPWQYSAPSRRTTSSKPAIRSRCARVMRAGGEGIRALGGSVGAVDRGVGVAAVEVRDDLAIGVAAHPADGQVEAGQAVEDLRRQRPRRDVAAHDDGVRAGEGGVGEDRVERRQVAVDVVEGGDDAHAAGPRTPPAGRSAGRAGGTTP